MEEARLTMTMKFSQCDVQVEIGGPKDAVKAMSAFGEVFGESECGSCNSENIKYEHRTDAEGHDYYSLKCVGVQAPTPLHRGRQHPWAC